MRIHFSMWHIAMLSSPSFFHHFKIHFFLLFKATESELELLMRDGSAGEQKSDLEAWRPTCGGWPNRGAA
ncbi:hypothetical protein Taro_015497 [Colocasia esculenta]|uniref:Uncharacterized protein n=1 Tax=Colocasia esculenta TaxID=4460 RepID=A0A843UQ22_COLES|nr:hypothetical protein [Colocasia esculenta]